ncbi:MAG TPA: TRAP transporter small permease [Sulfurimonas autotrophica]|nr:TRAP transporter small permease [Sulfurimonas autotrophica]
MVNFFNLLGGAIGFINRSIAMFGITAGVALAFANVVARYAFNYSMPWAAELTVYLFLWGMFFGAAYCFKIDGHISIGLLVENISKKYAKFLMLITRAITFAYLSVVAYYGYQYLLFVIELEEMSIDLEIPMWIPYLVIPVSFAFGAYRVGEHIVKLINTPADELVIKTETEELMEEAHIEKVVEEANRKTGGML